MSVIREAGNGIGAASCTDVVRTVGSRREFRTFSRKVVKVGSVVVPPFYSDFSLNFGRFYKPERAI